MCFTITVKYEKLLSEVQQVLLIFCCDFKVLLMIVFPFISIHNFTINLRFLTGMHAVKKKLDFQTIR